MKFYELYVDDSGELGCKTSENGEWVERDTAEQAARDAVEMARMAAEERKFHLTMLPKGTGNLDMDVKLRKAQAIIERYEGTR